MTGKRLTEWPEGSSFQPGEYALHPTAGWHGMTPNGLLCALRGHTVVEHEDGTITVSPSILVSGPAPYTWHGYLERGIWREC